MKKAEKETRARYLVVTSEKINNEWIETNREEKTLIANKCFWMDCHKVDYSSEHKIILDSKKEFMLEYYSQSPDKTKRINYTFIELI